MKIKLKGFIHKIKWSDEFILYSSDMSEYGDVLVGPAEFVVDYELPEGWNPVAAQVEALEKKLDSMANEYHGNVKQIKDRIAELQCIEHSPVGAA